MQRENSEVHAEADTCGFLAATEGTAQAEGAGLADTLTVANRQGLLATLETCTHGDAATRALRAGRIRYGLNNLPNRRDLAA